MNVTLAWDANTESDLAGYKVYYGTISGGPYNGTGASAGSSPIVVPLSSLANRSLPEYSVNNLPNATYYFVLTAYDSEGLESGYSNQVTVSPPVTQYQLSASVAGGNGTISPTSGTYNSGTVVNLTATPASWVPGAVVDWNEQQQLDRDDQHGHDEREQERHASVLSRSQRRNTS